MCNTSVKYFGRVSLIQIVVAINQNDIAQYGIYYYDQKGVISGRYGGLSKKLAKIGYFDKSGFESSIEEKISLPEIWLVFEKVSL